MAAGSTAREVIAALLARIEAGWRLRLVTMHDLRVGPRWGFGERRVPDWHLLWVRSGRGRYHLAGRPVSLEAGRILVLGPGYPHAARPDPADPPAIVPLRCALEPPAGAAAWRPPAVALEGLLRGRAAADMDRRCSELHVWWQAEGDRPFAGLHQRLLLTAFLLAALEPDTQASVVERDPMEALRGTLRSHPEQHPSVAAMARGVGLSEKHFIRAFRTRYGETPRAYHIRMRCERAAWLLEETAEPVAAIATALGYPDSASFCKQFKRVTGSTPGMWRAARGAGG